MGIYNNQFERIVSICPVSSNLRVKYLNELKIECNDKITLINYIENS